MGEKFKALSTSGKAYKLILKIKTTNEYAVFGGYQLQHFDFKPATKESGRVKPRNGFYFSICSTFDRNSL